jgi:transposase-like protein
MSKKRKKHGYAQRLKYMHMLEEGYSINYIHERYGINDQLLSSLWVRYQYEGPTALLKKKNVRANYAFKLQVLREIEENHITLSEASLKYNVSSGQIRVWRKIAQTQGYDALAIVRPRGRPLKNDMGRPRKKKPEEMTELERLRYENECLRAENALLKKVKALVEEREPRLREIGRKPSKN